MKDEWTRYIKKTILTEKKTWVEGGKVVYHELAILLFPNNRRGAGKRWLGGRSVFGSERSI